MLRYGMSLLAAGWMALVAAPAVSAATVQTPQAIVQSIANQLGAAIEGHQAEFREHPDRLIKLIDGIVLPHFDMDYASLLVLGRHAREATPAQRVAFAKAFYNALTRRYAEGLVAYTRGSVKVLPAAGPLDARRTIVRTEVQLGGGNNLSVDYVFRKTSTGEWKAYDVIVAGISYITNYRSQVDAEIRQEGIDGLIKRLQTEGAGVVDTMTPATGG